MSNEGLTSLNKLELQVYRCLGVNQFRKVILWFERLKHHKDNRKNENYHPSGLDYFALERYNGFLLYNAFVHIISLFFTLVYAVLSIAVDYRNVIIDSGMIIITLLNVYCIILQRTNSLKFKELRYKYYKRFLNRTDLCKEETLQKFYASEPLKLQNDYKLLCRIKKALEGKGDCFITCADAEGLKRICTCFEAVLTSKVSPKNKEVLEIGLIDKCKSLSGPYTVLQKRADSLQRLLGVSGRKMLDRTAIITEDAECERLYKKLFLKDTVYNYCLICFLLYEVFTNLIAKVETNEA